MGKKERRKEEKALEKGEGKRGKRERGKGDGRRRGSVKVLVGFNQTLLLIVATKKSLQYVYQKGKSLAILDQRGARTK